MGGGEREGLHSLAVEARKKRRASKRMTVFGRIAGCHRVLSFSPWRGVAFPFQAGRHSPPSAFNSQFARFHKLSARRKKVVEAGRKGNTCVMIASLWQWCGARQNVWHGLEKLSVSSSFFSFFFLVMPRAQIHTYKKLPCPRVPYTVHSFSKQTEEDLKTFPFRVAAHSSHSV